MLTTPHCRLIKNAAWALALLTMANAVEAVEVGDTVHIRSGGVTREAIVLQLMGNDVTVRYRDGRLPTQETLPTRLVISQAEMEKLARRERGGQLYQSIGRALGYMLGLALLIALCVWQTRRKRRIPEAVVVAEVVREPGQDR